VLNVKIKKKGEDFSFTAFAGVIFNPKLKNKAKLFFSNGIDGKYRLSTN
jgi:hypothetical protein